MKNVNFLFFKAYIHLEKWLLFLLIALITYFFDLGSCLAQTPITPRSYVCFRMETPPVIDGKLDEKAWKKAPWTQTFVDIEGAKKPTPLQKTKVKMLWDNQYLYIGAVLHEKHIWAYQDKKDQIVFWENDFEVFIDPDGDTFNYYELEINAINNTFDLFLPKPYRNGGPPITSWNVEGLKSAVSVKGTLNNASDTDKNWTLEIAIPFASLSYRDVPAVFPTNGSVWRINFSRVNWQHELADGKYQRRKDPATNRILPEYNWVWSPQGHINMHLPEYWGYLQFSSHEAGKRNAKFEPSSLEKMKLTAWKLHALQNDHFRLNKKFASTLAELKSKEKLIAEPFDSNEITMEVTPDNFLISIANQKENKRVTINRHTTLTVTSLSD